MNKYGICAWVLPMTVEHSIEYAAALGLNGLSLELKIEDGERLNFSDKTYRDSLLNLVRERNLEIPTLALNLLCDFGMCDPSHESRVFALFDESLRIAAEMGVKTIQVPSFFDSFIRSADDLNQTAVCLKYASEKAESYGLSIGWENAVEAGANLKMVETVEKDNFFIYFDTQNPLRFGGIDNTEVAEAVKQHVMEIHLKDSHDDVNKELCLGEGSTNFTTCIEVLSSYGFKGWIHLESEYKVYENFKEIIPKDISLMKSLFP